MTELPRTPSPSEVVLVLCHFPDADSATRCAHALLDARLAACVSVGAPVQSFYVWQGQREAASEVPLCAKTTAAAYAAVETAVRAAHPYELPDILAVQLSHGLPAYLAWVADAIAPPSA